MAGKSDYGRGLYRQLEDVMARLNQVERESSRKITCLNDRIAVLEKENDSLKKENQLLKDENARLRSIINNDSSNTSNPPSTDQKGGKPANTYNSRKPTARKQGGQTGHKGTTLTKADVEEKIRSGKFRHHVRDIGTPSGGDYLTKYILDLETVPSITEIHIHRDPDGRFPIPEEYRSDVTYGPNVKAMAAMLYSEGVMSNDRIAAFLNAVSGDNLTLSEGSIYQFCRKLSQKAAPSITKLEQELLNQEVVATDATTVTVSGKQAYIRNFSTEKAVIYQAMETKSLAALKGLRFLKAYAGTLVHDHETALYHFGSGHAECNVHIIRYLKKNTEDTGNSWSERMTRLLCGMNRARKEAVSRGETGFPDEALAAWRKEYEGILSDGRKENLGTKHLYAKKEEKTLLNRLEKYKDNHLLFLQDFKVPFDDNMSERDLRKAKNRQKMAGGFRKSSGQQMYCLILSVVETLKRRRIPVFENIKIMFMGAPAIF